MLAVDPGAALRLGKSDPKWALHLLAATTRRLRGSVERLEEFVHRTAEARIASAILRYASDGDRTAGASHQEIADTAGTSRETAARLLNALQARSVLRLGPHAIRIEDEEQLALIAQRPKTALAVAAPRPRLPNAPTPKVSIGPRRTVTLHTYIPLWGM